MRSMKNSKTGERASFGRVTFFKDDEMCEGASGVAVVRPDYVAIKLSDALCRRNDLPLDLEGFGVYASKGGNGVYEGYVQGGGKVASAGGIQRSYRCRPGRLLNG